MRIFFAVLLANFPKNREFRTSYGKFVPFFGVLCVHNFVVFMQKNQQKFSPPPSPMTDLWIRPWKTVTIGKLASQWSSQ